MQCVLPIRRGFTSQCLDIRAQDGAPVIGGRGLEVFMCFGLEEAVGLIAQSTASVMQFKEMVSEDKPVTKSSGLAANPSVGAFSGSFTNCIINISLK